MEYDPAHKTSSVTSTSSNTSSIWDPLPSLYYTGRAESVSSSAFEFDEPDSFLDEGRFILVQIKRYHDQVEEKSKNREILTNDQKRANHIASEQKRRNTIRGGFKELTELIPTLKNINHSKSTILFKSVDYIKKLEKGNKVLKERLTILQSPLLSKHHLFTNYHSISIPAMDDTPTTSTHNSPTLSHASSSLVNINSISSFHNALVIPLNNHSSAPSFTIPADEENYHINHYSERLLTSGKLDHLKKY
ncbi:uncharacterized protein BX663DRAFT_469280 [Cokeromyces recurvatus]|uniref:uncharacterized protein n=1 Tax=Cokeromyces recurvatus TaxID=90255 RepID=UPI00221EF4FF|nr:uncharacterized protein BX663DRAFT_469280 [Cokeromyces recurvatus]KAI7905347.1 hypothetical protein BX663DRAFT_469280 [Cokeromyces recurvatus]